MPNKKNYLLLVPCYKYCPAKRLYRETNGFCCTDEIICLATNNIPDQLYDLFCSNIAETTKFLTYVRTHNNKFTFSSFRVKFDRDLCKRNRGIYTFRTQ